MRLVTSFVFCSAMIACAVAAPAALAQAGDSENRARAEELFQEASGLVSKRDFAAACPKFEEVVRLQPQGIGAQMSLADCYVGENKLASAHAALGRAAELADRANQEDRAKLARERQTSLTPRLSRMLIVVPKELSELEGLSVLRNGMPLTLADLNAATPVDRGAYGIVVTAPGRKRFEKIFTVNDEATLLTATVSLPAEETAGASRLTSPAEPANPAAGSPWSAPRIAGIVMGVAGLGLVGAGLGLGVDGAARMDIAADAYATGLENGDEIQKQSALEEHAGGEEEATAGWVLVGVGGATTVAGVLLAIFAPSTEPDRLQAIRVAPWAARSTMGMTVGGGW